MRSFLLLFLLFISVVRATAQRSALDVSGNHEVAPAGVLQFLDSRCTETQPLVCTYGSLPIYELVEPLVETGTLFTAYYQAPDGQLYDVGSNSLDSLSAIELAASGPYYLLFTGGLSPTLLELQPESGHGRLLSGCALHLPLPPPAHY